MGFKHSTHGGVRQGFGLGCLARRVRADRVRVPGPEG